VLQQKEVKSQPREEKNQPPQKVQHLQLRSNHLLSKIKMPLQTITKSPIRKYKMRNKKYRIQ
jgi:hypothetical protein